MHSPSIYTVRTCMCVFVCMHVHIYIYITLQEYEQSSVSEPSSSRPATGAEEEEQYIQLKVYNTILT